MILFQAKSNSHKRVLLYAFACACFLSSCIDYRETFTDVYYIHNESEETVSLIFLMPVYWDTCYSYNIQDNVRIWFTKEELVLSAHKTIRIHPISRRYILPETHQADIASVIGFQTKLITSSDTIIFESAIRNEPPSMFPAMFTDDEVFSIYNTTCWQTVKDFNVPNTYYHTFHIATKNLEESKEL